MTNAPMNKAFSAKWFTTSPNPQSTIYCHMHTLVCSTVPWELINVWDLFKNLQWKFGQETHDVPAQNFSIMILSTFQHLHHINPTPSNCPLDFFQTHFWSMSIKRDYNFALTQLMSAAALFHCKASPASADIDRSFSPLSGGRDFNLLQHYSGKTMLMANIMTKISGLI